MIVHLVIHNNPLTKNHKGDPPLLKRFLSDRLGIKLQRQDKPLLVKPNIEVQMAESRKVWFGRFTFSMGINTNINPI